MDVTIKLDTAADADIIRQLRTQKSAEEYMKRLVREDIARKNRRSDELERAEKSFDATLNLLRKVASK